MKFNKILVFFVIVILIISFPFYDTKKIPKIIFGPYVQNMNESGVTIIWKTDGETEKNEIYWGKSIMLGNKTAGKKRGMA